MKIIDFETAKLFYRTGQWIGSEFGYDDKGDLHMAMKDSCITNERYFHDFYEAPYQDILIDRLRREGWHICIYQSNLPSCDPLIERWGWGYKIEKMNDPNYFPEHHIFKGDEEHVIEDM